MKSTEKFKMMLAGLSELYGKEVSETLAGMYWKALSDYSDEQILAAVDRGIKKWTCFGRIPTPAEIIGEIEGEGGDSALVAWEQLTEAVQRHGAYDSVMFADTRITRAVEALGGWIAVCNWNVADLHFRRNEFIKFYGAAKPLKEPKVLAGLVELDNKSRGYFDKVPQPAMVGTSEQLQRLEAPREVANAE